MDECNLYRKKVRLYGGTTKSIIKIMNKSMTKTIKIHISLERHLFTKELLLLHSYLGSCNSYPLLLSILDCFQLAATNVEGSSFSWW